MAIYTSIKRKYIAPAIYDIVDCGEEGDMLMVSVDTTNSDALITYPDDPDDPNAGFSKQSFGCDFGNVLDEEDY